MKPAWLGVCVLAACGISHDQPDASNTGSDGDTGDVPTMEIDGTGLVHFVDDNGISDAQENFTSSTITSITPRATGFAHRSGTGGADGSFSVLVDQGATTWDLGILLIDGALQTYLVGSAPSPDLSQYFLGRPGIVFSTMPTAITLTATGLASWGTYDDLELFSSNAGGIFFSPQSTFSPALSSGNTSFTNQLVPWTNQVPQLVDSASSDKIQLLQLSTKTSGTDKYASLARLGTSTTFTQADGQNGSLTLALSAVTQDKTLTVHWKRSQFEALRASAGPGATDGAALIAIDALPGATMHGFFSNTVDLVEFTHPPAGATDIDETFTYGNPFSTAGVSWDEFVIEQYMFNAPVKAPNTASAATVVTGSYAIIPVGTVATSGNVAPALTGFGAITVGGMDVTQTAQTGVGVAPLLTWHAPTGPLSGYQVTISKVEAANGTTKLTPVVLFDTSVPEVQIPDQILTAGTPYIAQIIAVYSAGSDLQSTPFVFPLPYAQFATVTAQWTP